MICLTAQSLGPRASDLQKLARLLEAGFLGREDKPEGIKEMFDQTWKESWGLLEEPAGGWPEGIRRCLAASGEQIEKPEVPVAPITTAVPAEESHEPEDVERLLFPDSDDEEQDAEQDAVQAITPSEPIARPCTPPPATPKLGSAAVLSTPSRPSKAASSPFARRSPSSPLTSSPMSSPSRRRRVSGKENAGLDSPSRVLSFGMPEPSPLAMLGKRRGFVEDADEPSRDNAFEPAKKARTTNYSESGPPLLLDDPFRIDVPCDMAPQEPSLSPSKKRKMVMYVELPARRRTSSLGSRLAVLENSSPTVVGGSGSSVRRTCSMLELKAKAQQAEQTPRKRRKVSSSSPASIVTTLFGSGESTSST